MFYTSYHSDIKIVAALNILPPEIVVDIPKSTLHRFRNTDYSSLFGYEDSKQFQSILELNRQLLQSERARQLFIAALYVKDRMIAILKMGKKTKSVSRTIVVNAVERVRDVIGLSRSVRLFGISISTFHYWKTSLAHRCRDSAFSACVRIWPNQLTRQEVSVMKKLLIDPEYSGWSVTSLAWYALKNNIVSTCPATWYKYVKLLNIKRQKAMPRRKKHKTGIRTDAPHKLWHMDITVFRTADNVPVYIYILMDNFSRYILNWSISLEKKADTTFEMLKQAYFRYIEPEIQKHSEVLLLNDGGSENYGEAVTDFTGSDDNIIKQIWAQVDIEESNSMIEACNKTLKYSFLYHQKLPDFHALELYLPKDVYEYNEVKPHYAHRYLTPLEVLEGYRADPDRFRQQLKQARIRRISQHRNPECRVSVL